MKTLFTTIVLIVSQFGCAYTNNLNNEETDFYNKISSLDDAKAYIDRYPNGKYKDQLLQRCFPVVSTIFYRSKKPKRYELRQQRKVYNDKGQVIVQRDLLGFGEQYTFGFQYDEAGKLQEKQTFDNGRVLNTISYEYDDNGNKSKEIEHYPNNKISGRYYKYADDGLLVEEFIERHGNKIESHVYKYDTNGNKIYSDDIQKTGVAGVLKDQTHYEYDHHNTLIKASFSGEYRLDGTIESKHQGHRLFTYDENGNLIKTDFQYTSKREGVDSKPYHLASVIHYIRDADGLLLEEQHMRINKQSEAVLDKRVTYKYAYILLKDAL